MTWVVEEVVRLIAIMAFVFLDSVANTGKDFQAEYRAAAKYYHISKRIRGWMFTPIWLFLKACMTASFFLYTQYTVTVAPNTWTLLVQSILFIAIVTMSWFWTTVFFRYHNYTMALVMSVLLMAMSWTYFGIAISGINMIQTHSLYLAPALLWLPHALWVTFAVFLSWEWAAKKYDHIYVRKEPEYRYFLMRP